MRFVRKGGIWKNTEDEILKVAVMKYGKNQWARISSLLVRKSAKQCKARWYEWLDPSVKKTEWSREEEEKLLHLAKIMPSQWRSIATLVGRTATQCLEHYGKLLDQAQALDQGDDKQDDLIKRLRPGDIDINPESKPARPDPIDMDEDEKEMLSEARARLANTKGKKAKRKAREKQLEEARRLATLQKRRELKAAGIEFKGPPRPSKNKNKRKEMDYNSEIPLERRVPKGFYDTSDEDHAMKRMRSAESFIGKSLAELDGKRRDEIEAAERKKDSKRQELLKKHDLPTYIAQIKKLNDPHLQRQRPSLNLPAPQITDKELHDLAAMGILNGDRTPGLARGPMATPTPMRTPAVGAGVDALVMEAQNLLALERSQTPLHGGENAFLHPSDFSSATPKTKAIQTPNSLALAGGLTPRSSQQQPQQSLTMMTPRTPIRDAFRINVAGDEYEMTPAPIEPDREQLRTQLGALPAPRNEFGLVLAEVPVEAPASHNDMDGMVPDAADVCRWERDQQSKEERIRFLLQSTALQRPELPRPPRLSNKLPVRFGSGSDAIEALIHAEMVDRLQRDIDQVPAPDTVTLDELNAARDLIDHELISSPPSTQPALVDHTARIYVPSRTTSITIASASDADIVEGYRYQFESLSAWIKAKSAAIRKQESATQMRLGAVMSRAKSLRELLLRSHRSFQQAVMELDCFRQLQEEESRAIPDRIRRLQNEVTRVVQFEDELQQQYRLLHEKCNSIIATAS